MPITREINAREQLKKGIDDNIKQLEQLINNADLLRKNRFEVKNILDGFSANNKDENPESRASYEKTRFDKLSYDLDDTNQQIEKLRQAIDEDKAAFDAFSINVKTEEFIELQNSINANLKKAASLELLIASQQRIIEDSSQATDTSLALKKRRIELLAEAATGTDNTKKLTALEADIANAGQKDKEENKTKLAAANKASDTAQGLLEMLKQVNVSIVRERHTLTYMLDALLMKMTNDEADSYKNAATNLEASARSLAAIDLLISKIGIRPCSGKLPTESQKIIIPFVGGMQKIQQSGLFFYGETGVVFDKDDVQNILIRLSNKGIEAADLINHASTATSI